MSQSFPPGAIAIIGMAGRFPGARDVAGYWRLIRDNVDAISRFASVEAEDAFDVAARADAAYVTARGILDDVDHFDAEFFAMLPREAALTDPQHRILLELAQQTFDDAGYDPLRVDSPVGVFAGCALNTYLIGHVLSARSEADAFRSAYGVGMYSHLVGALADTLAARIAYKLNLRGPAATVQAACATGLMAVTQACQSLQLYQCDMALAGASSITFPQKRGYLHQAGGMVSADGVCRPFDARASGTVFGAGAGLVLLKRLEDALTDGDAIHAIIRGFGVSNDGAAKSAFTAPSARGQAAAIRMALAGAELDARDIGYVECHGTATPIGDPIEIEGLRDAFGDGLAPKSCALGSVKANVGHLDAAAGISGLIKASLCVREGLLPGQLHFTAPNPALQLERGPFFIPHAHGEWRREQAPRRAGVSAFGVGGANVHLVLEQAPQPPKRAASPGPVILAVSGVDEAALSADAIRLADYLEASNPDDFAAIAATLQHGRRPSEVRAAFVAQSPQAAARALRGPLASATAKRAPRYFFACPGQGAQMPGMARAWAADAAFAADLERALSGIDASLASDLRRLLLTAAKDDTAAAAALRQTARAQPALVAIGWALARALARCGVTPAGLIGHSVGEITAAAISSALAIEEAMAFAAARGAAMAKMPEGAMLAVRARIDEIAADLSPALAIAAINAPDACVISGPARDIAELAARLDARGVVTQTLDTAHAFHSSAIDAVSAEIAQAAANAPFAAPQTPWISTLTTQPLDQPTLIEPDYWRRQAREPVRFADALTAVFGAHAGVLIEVGPGRASLGFAARTLPAPARLGLVPCLDDADAPLAHTIASLWRLGAAIDWRAVTPEPFSRQHLPPRSFRPTRHWIDAPSPSAEAPPPPIAVAQVPLVAPQAAVAAPAPTSSEHAMLTDVLQVLEQVSGAQISPADAQASFLELGFDSLLLGQVATRIEKRFGVKIGFRQMLADLGSPAALSAHIAAHAPQLAPAQAAPSPPTPAPSAPAASGDVVGLFKAQLDALNGLIAQQNAVLAGGALPRAGAEPVATSPSPAIPPPTLTATPRFRMFDPKAAAPAAPLSARQRAYIDDLAARTGRRAAASKAYADRHRGALADPRTASGFRPEWKELAFPVVAARAKGAYLWGLDGEDYVDLVNGYGQTAFGHAPDFVTDAIARQMRDGFAIGPQSPMAGPLAEQLADVLGMDRVTFCNTGSEAVMAAMRVARSVTGRDKVVVFANDYHGQFDEVLVKPGAAGAAPLAAGIPSASVSNMIVLAYGAPESLDWIAANASELAAVIVEPVQSRHPELQPFEFLRQLRAITQAAGAALVFDEVVTGFRVALGGMQAMLGLRADMATYGKVLGGGMPVGVLAGARRFMDALDGGAWRFGDDSQPEIAPTFFAGTFVRHPLVLAACAATLEHMRAAGPDLQRALTQSSADLAGRVQARLQSRAPSVRLERYASWFMLSPAPGERHLPLLCAELRAHGVHIQDGFPCFHTTSHTAAEADRIAAAFDAALDRVLDAGFFGAAASPIAAKPSAAIALTDAQLEILLAAQYGATASTAFNESVTLRFDAAIDSDRLARAFDALCRHHAMLRARIDPTGPSLVVADHNPLLAHSSADLDTVIAEHAATPFDLFTGPLCRATLAKAADRPALVFTAHHLICDGWSINVALRDLCALYAGEALAPAGDFAAFAETRQARAEDMAYWKGLFAEPPAMPALPRAPQSDQAFAGATVSGALSAPLVARLRKTGARHGCTLFATLFAGVQCLIAHLSGESDIAIGCAIAGQADDGFERVIGHGVQFLPLRAPIEQADTAAARLVKVRDHLNDALSHTTCTYGALVRAIDPPRRPDQPPLLNVQFNLERLADDLAFGAAAARITPNPKAGAHFDLFFNMIESDAGIRIDVDFRADRYDRDSVVRWIGNLERVLEALAADTATRVMAFDMLTPDERAWLAARQPAAPALPRTLTVTAAFDEMVRRQPDAPALLCAGETLSYIDLERRAARLAAALAAEGVGPGSIVALQLPRGIEAISAMLATLKCGAAYAPLDPGLPPALRAEILRRLAPRLVIAQRPNSGEKAIADLTGAADFAPPSDNRAAAYVMHTSGSTGLPKGVIVPHSGIVRLVRDQDFQPFGPGEVMLHAAPLAFDASTLEIWGALLTGGALAIVESDTPDLDAWAELFKRYGVTTAWLTAGLFHAIAAERPAALASLKAVAAGGDVVSPQAVRRVQEAAPHLRIVNGYGPTENTTFTACYRFAPNDPHDPAPIGAPIAHGRVYVCTPDLRLAPLGAAGELVVAGDGLALGYIGETDAARFCSAPDLGETRVYRTGDLVRWRSDGLLDFLGRRDGQVKINGHRIDLAGIEAALRAHPDVADAAAFVQENAGAKAIHVAVAPAAGAAATDIAAILAAHAQARLPASHQPAAIHVTATLPRTRNGKLDRAALAAAAPLAPAKPSPLAPQTKPAPRGPSPTAAAIAAIWASVLHRDGVEMDVGIFDLGADSLHIFRIAARMNEAGFATTSRRLLSNPSVATLASEIDNAPTQTPSAAVLPLAHFRRDRRSPS